MGVLRLELGLLIGNKIQLFVDGKLFNKKGIILIEEIEFKRDSKKGLKFAELFNKDNYDFENIKNYATTKIQLMKEIETVETLKKELLSNNYINKINISLKSELLKEYSEQVIEKAFNEVEIKIIDKNISLQKKDNYLNEHIQYGSFIKENTFEANNGKLRIGKYVRKTFNQLIVDNRISREEVEKLQRADYSKQTFDIQFPFLKKILPSDTNKILRYWKNPVSINGNQYFVCSEWYETAANNDRPYYESWLKRMNKQF